MTKQASPKYAPEVRERAVRMVFEHEGEHASQWAAISSIAAKIGCNPETLRGWVRGHRDICSVNNAKVERTGNAAFKRHGGDVPG